MTRRATAVDKDGHSLTLEYEDDYLAEGGEGFIFRSRDRKNIIKIYKTAPHDERKLTQVLFGILKAAPPSGHKAATYFAWPSAIIPDSSEKSSGVIMPDLERDGWLEKLAWFESAHKRFVRGGQKPDRIGSFEGIVKAAICVARAFGYLNGIGYGHGDISGSNVYINPVKGTAVVIDLDGLVVPGYQEGSILGTHPYMAPEIVVGMMAGKPILPSPKSDRHALAVILHSLLLMHHPIKGGIRPALDSNPETDDNLQLGKYALYKEHLTDKRNRPDPSVPYIPVKALGERMENLFYRAFVDGMFTPEKRPRPGDYEDALRELLEHLIPCKNPACWWKSFPDIGADEPICPFCFTKTKPTAIYGFARILESRGGFYPFSSGAEIRLKKDGIITRGNVFGGHIDSGDERLFSAQMIGTGKALKWQVTLNDPTQKFRCGYLPPHSGKLQPIVHGTLVSLQPDTLLFVEFNSRSYLLELSAERKWTSVSR